MPPYSRIVRGALIVFCFSLFAVSHAQHNDRSCADLADQRILAALLTALLTSRARERHFRFSLTPRCACCQFYRL
jgi:hypothetical protein